MFNFHNSIYVPTRSQHLVVETGGISPYLNARARRMSSTCLMDGTIGIPRTFLSSLFNDSRSSSQWEQGQLVISTARLPKLRNAAQPCSGASYRQVPTHLCERGRPQRAQVVPRIVRRKLHVARTANSSRPRAVLCVYEQLRLPRGNRTERTKRTQRTAWMKMTIVDL